MRNLISLFFVFIMGSILLTTTVFADWAYAFVVYDGNSYVISKTYLDPKQISNKIGKVTKYSDMEGRYSGNFSNWYPKGTGYYKIKGVNTLDAIAVKGNEGKFVKANYHGKYPGSKYSWEDLLPYVYGVILVGGITYFFIKNRPRGRF